MRRPRTDLIVLIVGMALALFGVHRNEVSTTNHAVYLAHATCVARNQGIAQANKRWANEKGSWQAAAVARAGSAKLETGKQRAIDLAAAKQYRITAKSIYPYQQQDCS